MEITLEEIIKEFNYKVDTFILKTGLYRDNLIVLLPYKYLKKIRDNLKFEYDESIKDTNAYVCGVKTIFCDTDTIFVTVDLPTGR